MIRRWHAGPVGSTNTWRGALLDGRFVPATNADRFLTVISIGYQPVRKWNAADARQAEEEARELEGDTRFRSLIFGISPPDALLYHKRRVKLKRHSLIW